MHILSSGGPRYDLRTPVTAINRPGFLLPFTALAEASVIVRDHAPSTNLFMCLWFNEVVRFTSRDQLSFPYVLRRLRPPGVHLFPVCARKDLVNSFGHRRKVMPLVKDAR